MKPVQTHRSGEPWDAGMLHCSPIFDDIIRIFEPQRWSDWPDCDALSALLPAHRRTSTGYDLRFVPQNDALQDRMHNYELCIAESGRVATRAHNLHDLFNAFMWCLFPRSKATLNALHCRHGVAHSGPRSRKRDALTLLDECGVLIAAHSEQWQTLHAQHQWHSLFWQHRAAWGSQLAAVIIGHGLYEQCLQPYVGLTGKALYLPVPAAWFEWPPRVRYQCLDRTLADWLRQPDHLADPAALLPMPILGVPGLHAENESEAFYRNTHYFRGKPATASSSHRPAGA